MRLIDSHCHLAHGRLRQQAPEAMDRARAAGVVAVVCAAGTVQESKEAVGLASRLDDARCLAGIHPHDAKDADEAALAVIEGLAGHQENAAVGEIGLDYHYNYSPPEDQRRAFAAQLALARRIGKRVVVHTREAFDDTLAILREAGIAGDDVLFHSFTGPPAEARAALDFGASVSFSGIVTFRKAEDLRRSAAIVPDGRLLIETDAPFLSPEPVRSMKTNEPANVAHVAAGIAAALGRHVEAVAEATTANAERFFGLELA